MSIHFKSALDSVRRSPFQAMSAVFVLFLTFFTATLFLLILDGSARALKYFETRPQVIAFLKNDSTEADIADLQHKLQKDSRVEQVRYVDKSQALAIYKKATSNNPQLGELVNNSIFPASLEFTVKDLSFTDRVISDLKVEKIIESVGFTAAIGDDSSLNNVVEKLKTISYYLRIVGVVLIAVLLFVSFVVLLTVISMRLATRREEIEILGLIGATNKFIRGPVIIEALIYSLTGLFFGSSLAFVLVLYIAPYINLFLGEVPFFPEKIGDTISKFGIVFAGELFLALLIAYIGGFLAVSRAKKVR